MLNIATLSPVGIVSFCVLISDVRGCKAIYRKMFVKWYKNSGLRTVH